MLNKGGNDVKIISMLELEKVLLQATKRLDIQMFEEFYIYTEDYLILKHL
jgi:hypothetical protein